MEDSHVSSYITSASGASQGNLRLGCGVRAFIGGYWNSWQDSNPQPRRSKRRALPVELQEPQGVSDCEFRISDLKTPRERSRRLKSGRGDANQIRNSQSEIRNFLLVGVDRIELSPRVPRTRMLALHHTPIELVRQVRLELTIPCLRGRCLDPIWLLTHGGTERTRTVIGLVDNQVPHLSATVPKSK